MGSKTEKTIKLSELGTMSQSWARVLAPIECDDVSFAPPAGLRVAGFAWAARPSQGAAPVGAAPTIASQEGDLGWEVDENLVDTVVAWSALGNAAEKASDKVECVIEVPYQEELPAEDLIHTAASGEFSLALVGLERSASAEQRAAYARKLKELALSMLKAANFSKSLYPFSNEFEALFLESMGKKEDAELMRKDWSLGKVDALNDAGARVEYALKRTGLGTLEVRAACQEALMEHFGSQDMVVAAMRALAAPVAQRVAKFAEEIKDQPKAKQDRFHLTE